MNPLLIYIILALLSLASAALCCPVAPSLEPCQFLTNWSRPEQERAIFIGDILQYENVGQSVNIRASVVESLLGLPKDLSAVPITMVGYFSCPPPPPVGQRRIFFGRIIRKPHPFNTIDYVLVYACNFAVPLDTHGELLQFVRDTLAGQSQLIYGKVVPATMPCSFRTGIPCQPSPVKSVKGAIVHASNGERTESLPASASGEFLFRLLPPGRWKLWVADDHLATKSSALRDFVEVDTSDGCANTRLSAFPNGRIAGIVRDATGAPRKFAVVEAFTRLASTEPFYPFSSVLTDENGRYELRGLPPREYVVGVDAAHIGSFGSPPPIYFGGGVRLEGARRIAVGHAARFTDVDFVTPVPILPKWLSLQVVLEEGSVPEKFHWSLTDQFDRTIGQDVQGNVGNLPMFGDEEYTLTLSHQHHDGISDVTGLRYRITLDRVTAHERTSHRDATAQAIDWLNTYPLQETMPRRRCVYWGVGPMDIICLGTQPLPGRISPRSLSRPVHTTPSLVPPAHISSKCSRCNSRYQRPSAGIHPSTSLVSLHVREGECSSHLGPNGSRLLRRARTASREHLRPIRLHAATSSRPGGNARRGLVQSPYCHDGLPRPSGKFLLHPEHHPAYRNPKPGFP